MEYNNWDTAQPDLGTTLDPLLLDLGNNQDDSGQQISEFAGVPPQSHDANFVADNWDFFDLFPAPPNPSQGGDVSQSLAASQEDQSMKDALLELQNRIKDLEARLDSKISSIEDMFKSLQLDMEGEVRKFCIEIDSHIKKLRAWAAEIKSLVDLLVKSQDQ